MQLKFGNKDVKPEATGFGVYDGPEPRQGVYNGVIKAATIRWGKDSGNPYFNILVEFEDNEGEKEPFNGYPLWDMIVPGDADIQQTRVAQLLNAVTGKSEATVDFNPKDAKEQPGLIKKIGGKDPIGTKVKVNVRREKDNRNADEFRVRIVDLFPRSGIIASGPVEVDEDVEPVDEDGGVDPDGYDADELREELEALGLVALKKRAKEEFEYTADDLKGKKAPQIIDEIISGLGLEDEAGEEDEEDPSDALREQLGEQGLPALKKLAKDDYGLTIKDLKGLDKDGVIEAIVTAAEAAADEDGEGEGDAVLQDEEGRWYYSVAMGKPREELVAMLVEAGYDEDDFADEEEYPQEQLVDTLVEEDVVLSSEGGPF